jgi:NAD(P)-dependent dehydrogenase (short-subunit alcohol dehydrogenase family)
VTLLLEDKVAIVTGAAKGLGLGVAYAFDAEGATVVVSDVNSDAAANAAASLDRGHAATCDVRDETQVAALIDDTVERHGKVDIVVANAGIATVSPLAQMSLEEWRALMAVNLDGVFLTIKHAARPMVEAGSGTIITMASTTALVSVPLIGHYAAAKAGVVSLTKTAALELRAHGIRVNAICPGFIGTDMVAENKPALDAGLGVDVAEVVEQAQGRFGTAEEVGKLAVFLASERSSFSSGSAYVLDGGATASLV